MQKHITHHLNIVLLTLLVGTGVLLPRRVTATLLTVINTNDSGGGSLRQAVSDAVSGDTINFASNVTGVIKFTNSSVTINQNLAILGPGARTLAVSGGASNIFNVGAGVVLIADLTLSGGLNVSGGGVQLAGGALTISNCIVSDNTAPPAMGGVGGAISASGGSLTVISSTFSGNRAHLGGGIYNNGAQVALSNTTFTANEATAGPDSAGAGIYNNNTLTILSCTIASNFVSSGSGFGGGIRNFGTVHLRNSIVAGNSAPTGADLEGAFISDGYNLIGTNSASTGFTNGVNNDLVGTNAMLGALQDNGGPTPTMALLAGSPAIDKGISGGLTTDQRGQPRPFDQLMIPNAPGGDGADIGAYESTFVVVNTNDSGPGSLRQAIQDNNAFGGNTITFSSAVTGVITLASALDISTDATIIGPGAKVLTISGNNAGRVFVISIGAVSISGLTIANGNSGNGAGIFSSAAFSLLTIQSCVFSNNNSTTIGGALWCGNPGAILNSTFRNNKAAGGGGGAIYAQTGLGITNCTFLANSATNAGLGRGGAIFGFNGSGSTYIYACTIVSNSAGVSGGGVIRGNSTVSVRNSIIARNTAPTDPDTTGVLTSLGYNFIGDAGSSTGWSTGIGDQLGSGAFPINPLLGPLEDNGGPTPTLSPLAGSPVIDKGKTAPGVTDQRGRPRPFDFSTIPDATSGDGSDIGALEVSPDSPQLNIQLAGSNVVLSWSTNATDFRLQSVTNLTTSNNWTAVSGTPAIVGNQYNLTNSAPTGIQFYRLIYP